jgi:hypothetical protein
VRCVLAPGSSVGAEVEFLPLRVGKFKLRNIYLHDAFTGEYFRVAKPYEVLVVADDAVVQ